MLCTVHLQPICTTKPGTLTAGTWLTFVASRIEAASTFTLSVCTPEMADTTTAAR